MPLNKKKSRKEKLRKKPQKVSTFSNKTESRLRHTKGPPLDYPNFPLPGFSKKTSFLKLFFPSFISIGNLAKKVANKLIRNLRNQFYREPKIKSVRYFFFFSMLPPAMVVLFILLGSM